MHAAAALGQGPVVAARRLLQVKLRVFISQYFQVQLMLGVTPCRCPCVAFFKQASLPGRV